MSKSDEDSSELRNNQKLLASAVLMVVLRIVRVPDRVHNQLFDAISEDQSPGTVNQLAAIIFDFLKIKY